MNDRATFTRMDASTQADWQKIGGEFMPFARQLHPDVLVAPGLMLGATDARFFGEVADNVYRFSPVRAGPADLARFHGTNERISVANQTEVIQFYHQLLQNASASPRP